MNMAFEDHLMFLVCEYNLEILFQKDGREYFAKSNNGRSISFFLTVSGLQLLCFVKKLKSILTRL